MSTVSIKMPEELVTRLNAVARRRGVSRSSLVRHALESYLRRARVGQHSAADLAKDLIGAFEGPRDLSHHPPHMEGFGR